MSIYYCS